MSAAPAALCYGGFALRPHFMAFWWDATKLLPLLLLCAGECLLLIAPLARAKARPEPLPAPRAAVTYDPFGVVNGEKEEDRLRR